MNIDLRTGRLQHPSQWAVRNFTLRNHGILATPTTADISPPAWLAAFDDHLKRVQGLSPGVRRKYVCNASRFVNGLCDPADPPWSTVSPEDISDFVLREASRLKPSACQHPVSAMRALLRFLISLGLVDGGITGAVPRVRRYRLTALPRHVSADDVARALKVCDDGKKSGQRDRAIVVMLARLGLRAGEVATLLLDDIDWSEGRILVRAGKTRRERSLPLSHEIGTTILAYLKGCRPRNSHRAVFLTTKAPFRPLSSFTVSWIARRRLMEAGVAARPLGAHVLRHTAATQMVRRGVPFKQIADVLGHQQLDSTTLYAKLDLAALAGVAMPWPK